MGKTHSKADGYTDRAKRVSQDQRGKDGQYGSLDSLSTAVSFSSHADRCLLKSYGSLDNLRPTDTATDQDTAAIKQRKGHYQLLEATCSEREELASGEEDAAREEADRELKEKAVQAVLDKATQVLRANNSVPHSNGSQGDIKVPNSLLEKLTAEDWNELVSFLCSYMEKSLQSSIVEQFRQIQASRPATSDSSGSSTEEITNHERQRPTRAESVKHRRHTSRKARPLSMPSFPHDIMHHQHHPHRRGCKTSNSPVDISIDDNCPADQDRLRACSSPQRLQTTCAGSPSTNRHKNGRVLPHRTTSATNTDELLRMATAAIEQEMNAAQGNYLTLAQLKDLGLSLRREQPNKGKEDNSQFSMQCWPSTEVDCLMRHRRQRPRKKRSRKIVGQTSKQNFQAESPNRETGQIADLEHVCYLGPEPIDSGRDSPATNMAVADLQTKPATKDVDKVIVGNKDLQEMCSQEENQPACYGVMHLHQHSHHHFHHVIHHSLSQSPEEQPCSASSPDVPLSQ